MISDLLARLAVLAEVVEDEELDVDAAVETVVDTAPRSVSEEERAELESLLPEWLEADDGF